MIKNLLNKLTNLIEIYDTGINLDNAVAERVLYKITWANIDPIVNFTPSNLDIDGINNSFMQDTYFITIRYDYYITKNYNISF